MTLLNYMDKKSHFRFAEGNKMHLRRFSLCVLTYPPIPRIASITSLRLPVTGLESVFFASTIDRCYHTRYFETAETKLTKSHHDLEYLINAKKIAFVTGYRRLLTLCS